MESKRAVDQVRRLIQREHARPAGAVRGLRGLARRRAWERLTRAGRDWSESERRWAAGQVLKDWADAGAPDEGALTDLVRAWAGREEFAALVMKGAEGRLLADAQACKEYCVRCGLAPHDPVEGARFYALTGQPEQRRVLDPDDSLTAAAYLAESAARRAVLRNVLDHEASSAAAGDARSPNLMRVITGGGTRDSAELADAERDYLRRWLLVQRDWDGLWDLTRGLSPLKAAAELRQFPAAWRPTAQRDRSLVSALRQADLESLQQALDALADVGVIHLEVPGKVRAGVLSDDGRRLAVWTHDTAPSGSNVWPDPPSPGTISVYQLPDVALLARHSATIWHDASLAYAGRELAAFTVRFGRDSNEAWLYHCSENAQPLELAFHDEGDRARGTVAMAAYGDGYVTAGLDHSVSFHSAAGRRTATQRYERPSFRGQAGGYIRMAAEISADVASGRIAIMRDYYGVLLDGQGRGETHIPRVGGIEQHVGWHHIAMQGSDVLLTSEGPGILRWDLSGHQRLLSYFNDGPRQYRGIGLAGAWDMVWIPSIAELCCTAGYVGDSGNVYYLDGKTYAVLPERRPLTGKKASVLISSASGTCYGLGGDGFADTVLPEHMAAQALNALAGRPLSTWRAAEARAVQETMWLAERGSRFRPLLDLLSACGDYSRAPGEAAPA